MCLKEIIADIFHRFHKPFPEEIILLHFSFALQKPEVCNSIIRSFLISGSFCSFFILNALILLHFNFSCRAYLPRSVSLLAVQRDFITSTGTND